MKRVRYSRSELVLSAVGLGSSHFGTQTDRETAFALMDRWLERGGNLIDTAHIYGASRASDRSRSEEVIGEWIAARGSRDRIVLCTKGGHPDMDFSTGKMGPSRVTPGDLEADLSLSLESLRTGYVDIYFLHRDDPSVPAAELVDWLEEKRRSGKIRWYGCSNWSAARIREALAYAEKKGYGGFIVNQEPDTLARFEPRFLAHTDMTCMDAEKIRLHRETGLNLMTAMTLANGYFHKRLRGEELPRFQAAAYGVPANDRIFACVERLVKEGIPLNSILHWFERRYPFPTVTLMGFSGIAQMDEVLDDIEILPPPEAIAELEAIRESAGKTAGETV